MNFIHGPLPALRSTASGPSATARGIGLARRLVGGLGFVAALFSPVHAAPLPWPEAPYSQYAQQQDLKIVLAEFAGSFSLRLELSPEIVGVVSGKFTSDSPTEFINRLAGVYGLVWYVHNGTLHVCKSSQVVTRTITLPTGGISNLRGALTDLGIVDPRFGWGELPGQNSVMVSGPDSYVKMLESTIRGLPVAAVSQQSAVFRLKYASADDRVIKYRDQDFTTPGLASILRAMVNVGGNDISVTGHTVQEPSAALGVRSYVPGAAAAAPDRVGRVRESGSSSVSSLLIERPGNSQYLEPTIQADTRLNALIIQDLPERIPVYRALIEELDVPTALIEIEAMILDVNTERASELGIDWIGRSGNFALGFGNPATIPTPGMVTVVQGTGGVPVNPNTIVTNGAVNLVARIRILESSGDASVQGRPSVLTLDNIGAIIDLSETFYIRVQGERVATVTPVTAGTTLRVTPRVINRGEEKLVQLVIDIEDGQIQDRQIDTLPTVRRSAVSTQAIVRPDDTLLIAGYSQNQNIRSQDKVPLLGDLPLLGAFFSNKSNNVQRRERLFMIRPRIVALGDLGSRSLAGAAPAVSATPVLLPPLATTAPATLLAMPLAPERAAPTGGFMLMLGSFDPSVAKTVRAKAIVALGAPADQITLRPEGSKVSVVAGPFDKRELAQAAGEKAQMTMNVTPSVQELPPAMP
jgi:type III secretion protein C